MYCSSCARQITEGLRYCNHCGARISYPGDTSASSDNFLISLVWAMVGTFVGGIGVMIGLIAVLKNYGFNEGLVNGFALMTFLAMLTIEGSFVWLLRSRLKAGKRQQNLTAGRTLSLTAENEPLQSAGSITESATRELDPVSRHSSSSN